MEQVRAPLIGRDGELSTVQDALRRAAAGEPSVVLVRGEAGVGKTRLVTTVLAELESVRQVVVSCAPAIAGDMPFAPFVDAVRDALRGQPQGNADSSEAWQLADSKISDRRGWYRFVRRRRGPVRVHRG